MRLPEIRYRDRVTGKEEIEPVYGEASLAILYGDNWPNRLIGRWIARLLSRAPLFSRGYGWLQNRKRSRRKVLPFINKYGLDATEFEKPPEAFSSFNDFFVRKLKKEARPIAPGNSTLIAPADGRYWVCPNASKTKSLLVKGKRYSIERLVGDQALADRYQEGSIVMARLCPTDYHRFHFPCDAIPSPTHPIEGFLASVNPVAVAKDITIFTENKRALCRLQTERFGQVLMVEVGATGVGTIHQTYEPSKAVSKGDEKGFFSFGGSSMILLFEPGRLQLDSDLVNTSQTFMETRCLMGQSLGKST